MKIFLISNMHPSSTDPLFGVFVKNFKTELEKQGAVFSKLSLIKGKSNSILKKLFNYIKHYFSCIKNYYSNDYDLIYVHYLTHHIPILSLFNFNKKRVVVNSHGSDIIDLQKSSILNFFAKKILDKAHLIIVPTSYFKTKVIEYYPFLDSDKICISPSAGIESHKFYFKENKTFSDKTLSLGFVSRFIEEKGWVTFLEALVELKKIGIPYKAVMAGKGPDENKILAYITKYKLETHLEFLGLVKQERLIDIYNSLDLYIFPTYREAESLGLTGLEAMSCGAAVVSCNVSGPTTYIKHNLNGFLFPPKATNELVDIIKKYYHLSDQEKSKICTQALKTAEEYESSLVNKKLYKKLKESLLS